MYALFISKIIIFLDIRTMECLQRKNDVKSIALQEPNFGEFEVSKFSVIPTFAFFW